MLTLDEICDRMSTRYDPDEVVELLEITTEQLLDHFGWLLEAKMDELNEELSDE